MNAFIPNVESNDLDLNELNESNCDVFLPKMLQCFAHQLNALKTVVPLINAESSKKVKKLEILTLSEWAIMGNYTKLFEPIAKSLDRFQGEEITSAGSFLPCLFFIRRSSINFERALFLKVNKSLNYETK